VQGPDARFRHRTMKPVRENRRSPIGATASKKVSGSAEFRRDRLDGDGKSLRNPYCSRPGVSPLECCGRRSRSHASNIASAPEFLRHPPARMRRARRRHPYSRAFASCPFAGRPRRGAGHETLPQARPDPRVAVSIGCGGLGEVHRQNARARIRCGAPRRRAPGPPQRDYRSSRAPGFSRSARSRVAGTGCGKPGLSFQTGMLCPRRMLTRKYTERRDFRSGNFAACRD